MNCIICQKKLVGKQKKFCSTQCKAKDPNQHSYLTQKKRGLARKKELVEFFGGQCTCCGYSKNLSALCFHHIDPTTKVLKLDMRSLATRSWDVLVTEAKKCNLLCANCHAEEHNPDLTLRN